MVEGSAPLPLDRTAHPGKDLSAWERHYADRARGCGVFLACEAEFLELVDPPIATDGELITIFGGEPPATQTPPEITRKQYEDLVDLARRRVAKAAQGE